MKKLGRKPIPPEVRFWAKVKKVDDCWYWQGGISHKGYGKFQPKARLDMSAHKYSYELKFGKVPTGFDLHHTCKHKRCVNPDHLVPVDSNEHRKLSWEDRKSPGYVSNL